MASAAAAADPAPPPAELGPISPELVLVDPELREAALARLEIPQPRDARLLPRTAPAAVTPEPAPLSPAPAQPRVVVPDQRRRRIGARLVPAIVPLALVFGVVVAMAGSEIRSEQPTLEPSQPKVAAPTQAGQPSRPVPSRRTASRDRAHRAAPKRNAAVGAVERLVLAKLVLAPKEKLPPALIDPATGLARNNLHATCRAAGAAGAFVCIVRPAAHEAGEGLTVRYRRLRGGRVEITWGRYRPA